MTTSIMSASWPRSFGKWIDLLFVLIALFVITQLSGLMANIIYPSIQRFDPDDVFLWISVHHLVQLVLTIALMVALGGIDLHRWGFNFENWRTSLVWIIVFASVFAAVQFYWVSGIAERAFAYPLTNRNMGGLLTFQYGLSGLSEEPLFRGFVMVFLASQWTKIYKPFGLEVPVTVLISTALFMLFHVNFHLSTLSISGFDFDQQMMALQLGLLYGVAFHYTKSLLVPIVCHGLSNGITHTLLFTVFAA